MPEELFFLNLVFIPRLASTVKNLKAMEKGCIFQMIKVRM
jgi:hypothetical protein